jgi:hypothetical protein
MKHRILKMTIKSRLDLLLVSSGWDWDFRLIYLLTRIEKMIQQIVVPMNKPAGMPPKEFKQVVSKIENVRLLLSYEEKQKCQEVLKLAGIKQSTGQGSLNFCIKPLLSELTPLAREATELHMKINALPVFLELVIHSELWEMSQKEVDKNKPLLLSKGYVEIDDYFQKKVWSGNVCRVILISKGIGKKSAQFYRCEAFFRKGEDMPFEEKEPVYSQYLKDLIV